MRELLRIARERGLTVHATHMPDGYLGYYEPDARRIWFDIRLTIAERRVTIAHELGHEYYGDVCSSRRAEHRADAYAAHLLVDPVEYARLEMYESDIETMAEAFAVTEDCIRDFRRFCLYPMGGRTYLRRHGKSDRVA